MAAVVHDPNVLSEASVRFDNFVEYGRRFEKMARDVGFRRSERASSNGAAYLPCPVSGLGMGSGPQHFRAGERRGIDRSVGFRFGKAARRAVPSLM